MNDQASKDRVLELAQHYFGGVRPFISAAIGETDLLRAHDEHWQQLVRLAYGNNARRTYLRIVSRLRKHLTEFSVSAIAAPVPQEDTPAGASLSSEEVLILKTLEAFLPSAAASYRQGIADLRGAERLSYRGTAAEFREALRESLDHLAPDAEVEKQEWYAAEDRQTKPTMKQKAGYVLRSRGRKKALRMSAERTLRLIEELFGEVMRDVYTGNPYPSNKKGSSTDQAICGHDVLRAP